MAVPRWVLENTRHLDRFILIYGFNLSSPCSFSQLLCESSHLMNWGRKRHFQCCDLSVVLGKAVFSCAWGCAGCGGCWAIPWAGVAPCTTHHKTSLSCSLEKKPWLDHSSAVQKNRAFLRIHQSVKSIFSLSGLFQCLVLPSLLNLCLSSLWVFLA